MSREERAVIGNEAVFPRSWGTPPDGEEQRAAWIVEHVRADAPATQSRRRAGAETVNMARATYLAGRRYGPGELTD